MKSNKLNLALVMIFATLAPLAAKADKYVKMPNCEPLKPKLELIKEAHDDSKDWELKLDLSKDKRVKLNNACNEYKAAPTAPNLKKFQDSRDEFGQAYNFLKDKTIIVKKKLADSKSGLVFLKDKTPCKSEVKNGEDVVKKEFDDETAAASTVCQVHGAQARR